MDTNSPETPPSDGLPQAPGPVIVRKKAKRKARVAGVPLWLPLLALILALLFAAFIAIRISPTLSALVSPPEPVLPPGSVLQSQGSDSIGDWWLYQTSTPGCETAKFYMTALGACIYDPSSGCSSTGGGGGLAVPGANEVAECSGHQSIGQYGVMWRVYITASYAPNNTSAAGAIFRIYRDID